LLSVSALLPDANLMVRWYQRIDEIDAGLGLVHVVKVEVMEADSGRRDLRDCSQADRSNTEAHLVKVWKLIVVYRQDGRQSVD
jgi:hypothetical protein